MTKTEATAEIFITAFNALSKQEKDTVVQRLLSNKVFREDIIDWMIIEKRKKEPSRTLSDYLKSRANK
jgi:hypothetical protein